MATRTITLNGGLVTAKPPALLSEGELALAQGIEYLPGSVSARKMEGFTAFSGAGFRDPFIGYLRFKSGLELIARAFYTSGGVEGVQTGMFAHQLKAPTVAPVYTVIGEFILKVVSQIDLINYGDEYFILFGGNSNLATDVRNYVNSGGVARYHGMLPNAELASDTAIIIIYPVWRAKGKIPEDKKIPIDPKIPTVETGGVSAGFTLPTGSSISYWIEERVKDSFGNITRRNVGTSASVIKIQGYTGFTFKPVITRPAQVNSDATHWALYGTATNSVYPSGFQIDEVPIADTTIQDTRTGASPAAPAGVAYGVLTANIGGVLLTVPKFGTAPLATIGDEFEGSLCCDDPDVAGLLRYSLSGDFDHFPVFNAIQVGRKDGERITMIKRLGRNLMVGTTSSLYRISTLLRVDQDAGFNLSRTIDLVEENFGVVNQKAATRFATPTGPQLAYLTTSGLRATDGQETFLLTENLDWVNTVARDHLSAAFIVDNPEKFRIELYYPATGVVPISQVYGLLTTFPAIPSHSLHFYYGRSQIRPDGLPKITGPHPIQATAGCLVQDGERKRVYITSVRASDYNTFAVKTDGGVTQLNGNVSADIAVDVKTGEFYLGGIGNDAVLSNVALHHSAGAFTQEATVKRISRREGHPDLTVSDTMTLERAGLSTVSTLDYGAAESVQFEITNSDTLGAFEMDFLHLDYEPSTTSGGFSKTS